MVPGTYAANTPIGGVKYKRKLFCSTVRVCLERQLSLYKQDTWESPVESCRVLTQFILQRFIHLSDKNITTASSIPYKV